VKGWYNVWMRATKIKRDRQDMFPVSHGEQVLVCKHTNCKSDTGRPEITVKTLLGHEIGSCPEKDDEKE
jgi:hypothetical protein